MKSEKLGRVCFFAAGLATSAMALYHFRLPHIWGWERFAANLPPAISWGLFSINFFFSFLLLWGGLITIIAAFRLEKVNRFGWFCLLGVGIFWVVNAVYQIAVPMPLPESMRVLKWGLLAFALVVALLYLLPIFLLAKKADANGKTL